MHRVFNCGIGLAIVVSADHVNQALQFLKLSGLTAWSIGDIVERPIDAHQTIVI